MKTGTITWIIIGTLLGTAGITAGILYLIGFEKSAQMGETLGGIAGSISLILIVVTIMLQRKELADTISEMNKQSREITLQTAIMREDLRTRKWPVVSVQYLKPDNVQSYRTEFPLAVSNISKQHAKVKIKVTLKVDGKIVRLPEQNPYSGHKMWPIPAHSEKRGAFRVGELLDQLECDGTADDKSYEIIIDLWVTNYYDKQISIDDEIAMNPPTRWYWNKRL